MQKAYLNVCALQINKKNSFDIFFRIIILQSVVTDNLSINVYCIHSLIYFFPPQFELFLLQLR